MRERRLTRTELVLDWLIRRLGRWREAIADREWEKVEERAGR